MLFFTSETQGLNISFYIANSGGDEIKSISYLPSFEDYCQSLKCGYN
jgi:hypothetical protein